MRRASRQLIEAQDLVERRIGHDARHQRSVHGVSGTFGDHVAEQRLSDQRKIADQIQRFMAAALVVETQAACIADMMRIEADGEIVSKTPAVYEVVPLAVTVIVPEPKPPAA